MSIKDHYLQVVNPDQCHKNNTSIERVSKPLSSLFVKNIKISINVQSSSKINAVDESLLLCSDYQTFPNKCRFSVLLKLLEFKDADTLTLLPYTVKIHEEDEQSTVKHRSTCYVFITVYARPLSLYTYSKIRRSQGYYIQQKIHSESGLTCLDFLFIQPLTEYVITFSLVSAIDENGRDINFHNNKYSCFLETVCESTYHPDALPVHLKFIGPLKGENYATLTENFRKLILSGNTNRVRKITDTFLASSNPCDVKVVALIHSGFSHQTKSYKTTKCFEDSKRELDKALKMCRQGDCVNTSLLEGRTYTFMAQNYIFAERYKEAWDCINAAKTAFFYAAECTEMSGLVYQEVMILSIEFEVISTDEQKRKLEELIRKAIHFARLGDDYQAICLTAFMHIKKAMLHLGIFNLQHPHFQGRMLVENFTPSDQDIVEAKNNLFLVPQEYIKDDQVSSYKAMYYFALSEYYRHTGDITQARKKLILAEEQVEKGKFDFPLEEIEVRHSLFSKMCPLTTDDSIQEIFGNFVIQSEQV